MPLAEVLHLVHGQVVAGDVQPRVEEHGAVARGQHEAVTVHPGRVLGVVRHALAPEHGADLRRAERQAEARRRRGDGVHGQAAGLVSRRGEGLLHGRGRRGRRRHLERAAGGAAAEGGRGEGVRPHGEGEHESTSEFHPGAAREIDAEEE